ncbi:MAG: ATP-dependent helicase HrpA [Devosia sp.]|uniref:endonuclease domain-containing protein n=1 Tax=Devosia sp. TaxID=1871048 RepID=UPI002609D18F|nr:endonuclease domain-containing protein [Devosia sp.]MDB5589295.1 ATP-dependent helicase HrpA [Devosia sp.]
MEDRVSFARRLRRNQTGAEQRCWAVLHSWRVNGWHFRRQAPIGPFVVDFVCKREKLVIEIDGDSHYSGEGIARDEGRTAFLEGLGYRVVRFSNDDVMGNAEGVFEVLRGILGEPDGRDGRETPT